MNIEVGKFYKTRDGRKARIYAVDGGQGNFLHGAIYNEGYWATASWFSNGTIYSHGESPNDLIAPWIDKPEFDRNFLPKWKAIAMESSGSWWAFSEVPYITEHYNYWDATGNVLAVRIPSEHAPKWSGDWKDSLLTFDD